MKIDFPTPSQSSQLVALWQEAFGDSMEFIEGFFCTGYAPARCRCMTIDGQVVAALYWLDAEMDSLRYAYLYAVAVSKAHQGKGLGRALMEDTRAHLAYRGYDGILLYPQNDSLRTMYEKMGYTTCTYVSRFTCKAGDEPVALRRIDRDEYAALRRTYLPAGSVLQENENIAYMEMMAFFYAGEDFLLAAGKEGQTLYAPELLGNPAAAPGILAALHCTEGQFQTTGNEIPLAMYLPLSKKAKTPKYLGLVFN